MRAFAVELVHEGIEAGLLLQAVLSWRPGGLLFQSQVHAFVTAVLLRATGLDALDGDAEAEPPHREPGEVEQSVGTGEGHAIVGADRSRQAPLAEQPLEGG